MPWLVRGEEVLCSLEVATGRRARRRGLLGRDGVDGALLLTRCRSVHTLGMRFPLDVAFIDGRGRVVDVVSPMAPWRLGRTRWSARQVVEAGAGSFERWGLAVGDVVEVR